MEINEKRMVAIFKAFCDERRIKILSLVVGGEICACKLLDALNISQPNLSHHMKILCDAGIVVGRKEGKWMHYSISKEGVQVAQDYLGTLASTSETCCSGKSCCGK